MKGKYVFTLGKPSLIPFLTYAKDRNLRERLYRGYLNRGANGGEHDNTRIVERIVRLRSEKAALLGYPSYAALKLDGTLAATPERVYEMFDRLWEPTLKLAGEELAEMKAIKAAETGDSTFASWDWWYYAERASPIEIRSRRRGPQAVPVARQCQARRFHAQQPALGTDFPPRVDPGLS